MSKGSLSTERILELRQLVRSKVSSDAVQRKIKQYVGNVDHEEIDENTLIKMMEDKGLVEEVMAGLGLGQKNNFSNDSSRLHIVKTDGVSSSKEEEGLPLCLTQGNIPRYIQ